MSNPDKIYLEPWCEECGWNEYDQAWGESPNVLPSVSEGNCPNCYSQLEEPVVYIRSDLIDLAITTILPKKEPQEDKQ